MSRRFYIETNSSGKQQFVKLKRSRSSGHEHRHHRHHHHHHGHHDAFDHHHHYHDEQPPPVYYKVSVEEWNLLKERERIFEANNRSLIADNNALRASLAAAQADVHRYEHVEVPQLRAQNHTLSDDNDSLRRSLDNAADMAAKHVVEEERLNAKIDKLTKQNKESQDEALDLRAKVRSLQRQLEGSCSRRAGELAKDLDYWKDKANHWKIRFEDLQCRYEDLRGVLDSRRDKMRIYEDILKRNGLISP